MAEGHGGLTNRVLAERDEPVAETAFDGEIVVLEAEALHQIGVSGMVESWRRTTAGTRRLPNSLSPKSGEPRFDFPPCFSFENPSDVKC